MAGFTGNIELISGITPKNNGDFPLVAAKDVEMPDGTRLSDININTDVNDFYYTVREELEIEYFKDIKPGYIWGLYEELIRKYPDKIVKSEDPIGVIKDAEGKTLYSIYEYTVSTGDYSTEVYFTEHITNSSSDYKIKKPKYLITSGMHGNEAINPLYLYQFIRDLVTGYNIPDAFREGSIIHFIPVLNPWGLDRYGSVDANGKLEVDVRDNEYGRYTVNGFDINQNFDWNWKLNTSSNKGTKPESEIETQIIVKWLKSHLDADLWIDLHNSSNTNEPVVVISCSNSNVSAVKKIALRGIDNVIPFWRDSIGYPTSVETIVPVYEKDKNGDYVYKENWEKYRAFEKDENGNYVISTSDSVSEKWAYKKDSLGNYTLENLGRVKYAYKKDENGEYIKDSKGNKQYITELVHQDIIFSSSVDNRGNSTHYAYATNVLGINTICLEIAAYVGNYTDWVDNKPISKENVAMGAEILGNVLLEVYNSNPIESYSYYTTERQDFGYMIERKGLGNRTFMLDDFKFVYKYEVKENDEGELALFKYEDRKLVVAKYKDEDIEKPIIIQDKDGNLAIPTDEETGKPITIKDVDGNLVITVIDEKTGKPTVTVIDKDKQPVIIQEPTETTGKASFIFELYDELETNYNYYWMSEDGEYLDRDGNILYEKDEKGNYIYLGESKGPNGETLTEEFMNSKRVPFIKKNPIEVEYTDITDNTTKKFTNYEYVIELPPFGLFGNYRREKPKYLILSGIHGYERNSIISTYKFIRDLVTGYNIPLSFRDGAIIHVMPVGSPYSSDMLQRYNGDKFIYKYEKDENNNDVPVYREIDVNRNFDWKWEESSNGYKGAHRPNPESTVKVKITAKETLAISKWLNNNKDADLFIDIHNGQMQHIVPILSSTPDSSTSRIAQQGVERVIPFWRDVMKFPLRCGTSTKKTDGSGYEDAEVIFTYAGIYEGGGTALGYAENVVGIPSICLELSAWYGDWGEFDRAERRLCSPVNIAMCAEAIGNILIEFFNQGNSKVTNTVLEGAVLYTSSQSLSEEEKALARANIGAAPVGSGSITATDDEEGNVEIVFTGSLSVEDVGDGDIVIYYGS